MQELIYRKSEKDKKRGVLLSFMIIALSILALILSIPTKSVFMLIVFAVLLIFGIYFVYKAIQNSPTVVVNQNGITSNVNGMGLIKWEFIEEFEIKKAVNTDVLIVKINNQEKLFQTINGISKVMMKSNIKKLGSPVVIPKTAFDKPLEVVLQEFEIYKKACKFVL